MDHPEHATETLYAVLGVPADAEAAALRRAWRSLVARHHPDRFPGDSAQAAIFLRIQEAYRVLSDPQLRARYDASLLPGAISGEPEPIEAGLSARPGASGCFRPMLPQARGHCDAELLSTLWAGASRLPWQSLVRIRTLLAALALGAIVLAWQVATTRSRTLVLPPGSPGHAHGPAARPLPANALSVSDAIPARPPRDAGFAGSPASPRIPPGLSLPARHTAAVAEPGSGDPWPPSPESSLLPEPGPSNPLLGFLASPVSSSALLSATQPQQLNADSPPSSGGRSAEQEYSPDAVADALPPAPLRFLAGCASHQGTRIWVGVATLRGQGGSLTWRSWDASPGDAHGAASFVIRPMLDPDARSLASHDPDRQLLGAALHHAPGSFSRLSLRLSESQAPPCTDWHLVALPVAATQPGPVRAPSTTLAGRWLRPESKGDSSNEPFPVESMEILIGQNGWRWQGEMRSRHRINPAALPHGSPVGMLPPPVVQFTFGAPADGFAGDFSWTLAGYGAGTLTVAPVSPVALAIRWRAGVLEPGALRLTGAAALLRRR